ncbi:hypothetical protein PISL3812_08515 [Talaromyces islandicus]|uniref:Protein kinase domain-containing protein n=1 Tax=Talaromyces islandicus TaxID=28573 RepID=A0A0U1M975_TALIS|nr:hypothetical protein PISL3812_08515 [Talaromyces islandicus]
MSTWKFDFTGRVEKLTRNGNSKDMIIEKQLTEVENEQSAQRNALIRYDLNPRGFDIDDLQENRALCEDDYLSELEIVETVHSINHGPALLDWYTKRQPEYMPYPKEGIMDVYVVSLVPGENLDEIFEDLGWEHLRVIRAQLTYILNTLRIEGRILSEQHPRFLNYDKKAKRLYFFDFTFFREIPVDEQDKYGPITQYDDWVLAFNIWPYEMLRSEAPAPTVTQGPPTTPATTQYGTQGLGFSLPPPILPSQMPFSRQVFLGASRRRDRDENRPPQRRPGSSFAPEVPSGGISNLQLDDDDDEGKPGNYQ